LSLEREFERADPHWPAQLAILAAIGLHIALPERVTVIPDWIVPVAELVLFIGLFLATRRRHDRRRTLAFVLIGLVLTVNTVTLGALVDYLLDHRQANGNSLLLSGVDIYITGILIFAVLFWELDRGGPEARASGPSGRTHFQFASGASPRFVDYLYLSFTNCTAFSPTDTMPLTAPAKLLMMVEGAGALATAAVVLARGVSLLGG
jgi:uncharacterized membrane protein